MSGSCTVTILNAGNPHPCRNHGSNLHICMRRKLCKHVLTFTNNLYFYTRLCYTAGGNVNSSGTFQYDHLSFRDNLGIMDCYIIAVACPSMIACNVTSELLQPKNSAHFSFNIFFLMCLSTISRINVND